MTGKELTDLLDCKVETSERSNSFESEEQYYTYFENNNVGIEDAISKLVFDDTVCSIYVLIQILGNPAICQRFGWRTPEERDFKVHRGLCENTMFGKIYNFLFSVIMHSRLMMKGIVEIPICSLTLESFKEAFNSYTIRTEEKRKRKEKAKKKSKGKRGVLTTSIGGIRNPSAPPRPTIKKEGKLYTDFEYGLSDW